MISMLETQSYNDHFNKNEWIAGNAERRNPRDVPGTSKARRPLCSNHASDSRTNAGSYPSPPLKGSKLRRTPRRRNALQRDAGRTLNGAHSVIDGSRKSGLRNHGRRAHLAATNSEYDGRNWKEGVLGHSDGAPNPRRCPSHQSRQNTSPKKRWRATETSLKALRGIKTCTRQWQTPPGDAPV